MAATSSTTICANAGIETALSLSLSGFDAESRRYAIASQELGQQVVLSQAGTASGITFNLNGLPAGLYRAVAVGYQQGTSLAGVAFQSQLQGCYDLSNIVSLTLTNCLGAELTSRPNPSSGQSIVLITNPRDEYATLEVWDMNDRLVQTLFQQVVSAGQEYSMQFNGSHLPNGVYLYRLTTQSEIITHK